jgi:AGZA family xanthine/uracil permease-like MFS transporter
MSRYHWARTGDVNAFFGLMLDNVAVMIVLFTTITSTVLPELQKEGEYRFTPEFVLIHMIPGTALGVLLGDLVYTWMAFRLARRTGRSDVTAMPLGLDTPSTFGVAFFVLLPALAEARKLGFTHDEAMLFAWRVGVVVLLIIGAFKVVCAPIGNAVRRWVPQAGLLGSLAAIALALIAFLPLVLDGIAGAPLVGMVSLMIILITLVAHRSLPGHIPGALAAVAVGVLIYWVGVLVGERSGLALVPAGEPAGATGSWHPPDLFLAFGGESAHWKEIVASALNKLPLAIPFALATIVGGIDCTESAAAAGDEYDTRTILLTEGVASVIAAGLGGVIQTTPYIGQPAYKTMGGRAAYTLATALFIGTAGYFGWFAHLFELLPRAAMFPILVYVGLEITSQSFRVIPTRHYPALALAALPAMAAMAVIFLDQALAGRSAAGAPTQAVVLTLHCLAGGFIITSLLWAAALAALSDGRLSKAAAYLVVAAGCALFGVIHSPLPGYPIALPTEALQQLTKSVEHLPPADQARFLAQSPFHWAGAYALCALLLLGLSFLPKENASQES